MYYKHNTDAPSWNHCCREIGVSITYSKCVSLALVIQQLMRMRRVLLSYCGMYVCVSDREASIMRGLLPTGNCCAVKKVSEAYTLQ